MAVPSDVDLVPRLRAGDGAAFRFLVGRYQAPMIRLAETFVPGRAVAEEVVQDTWIAVIKGIDRFEGRAALKTWIFRILANQARTRGVRERRTVPMSSLADELTGTPSVPSERFAGRPGHGMWVQPLGRWSDQPEDQAMSSATFALVDETVQVLPENQRRVIIMRDVEGWTSQEVCDVLEISEVNQRVLLHRARSHVRAVLEEQMEAQR